MKKKLLIINFFIILAGLIFLIPDRTRALEISAGVGGVSVNVQTRLNQSEIKVPQIPEARVTFHVRKESEVKSQNQVSRNNTEAFVSRNISATTETTVETNNEQETVIEEESEEEPQEEEGLEAATEEDSLDEEENQEETTDEDSESEEESEGTEDEFFDYSSGFADFSGADSDFTKSDLGLLSEDVVVLGENTVQAAGTDRVPKFSRNMKNLQNNTGQNNNLGSVILTVIVLGSGYFIIRKLHQRFGVF